MRKPLILTLSALLLAGCGESPSGPADMDEAFAFTADAFGATAYGLTGPQPGRGLPELARLDRLPDSLALTPEQEAEIDALLEAFQTAWQADLDALATRVEEAKLAREEGAARATVVALLAEARAIHVRMAAARLHLRADLAAVLTVEQKNWLSSRPERCNPGTVPPLTDAQKQQIRELQAAFQQANAADVAAVKAALEQARAARQAGADREEVRAILEGAKEAWPASSKPAASCARTSPPSSLPSSATASASTAGSSSAGVADRGAPAAWPRQKAGPGRWRRTRRAAAHGVAGARLLTRPRW